MNIQTMLLPHKHVRFGSSLVAVAGYIRVLLNEPRTLDEIWAMIDSNRNQHPIKPTFTQLVLAVDILFAIKQASSSPDGRISLIGNENFTKSVENSKLGIDDGES